MRYNVKAIATLNDVDLDTISEFMSEITKVGRVYGVKVDLKLNKVKIPPIQKLTLDAEWDDMTYQDKERVRDSISKNLRIQAIKTVREVLICGLGRAKQIVDSEFPQKKVPI